jgi:dihydroflavonol-4-reductase
MNPVTSAPVLVTGATGFLASHLIQQLLAKGYKVKATVRDLRLTGHVEHLFKFPEAASSLELVEMDLLLPETIEKAVTEGIEYVFHCATTHSLSVPEGKTVDNYLYDPAVTGTINMLKACSRVVSVKKFIMTSCIQALSDDFDNNKVYNELDWNALSTKARNPYAYSKTCAEKAAWEFMEKAFDNNSKNNGGMRRMNTTNNYALSTQAAPAEEAATSFINAEEDCYGVTNRQMRLITLLPGVMLGPHLGGKVNYSHRYLLIYLEARIRGVMNLYLPIADVRDVAACHILTMESYRAEGSRYCLTNKPVHMVNILQTVHENFSDIKLPARKLPDGLVKYMVAGATAQHGEKQWTYYNVGRIPNISCIKAKGLGMTLRPPVQTIVDTVRYLIDSDNVGNTVGSNDKAGGCTIM